MPSWLHTLLNWLGLAVFAALFLYARRRWPFPPWSRRPRLWRPKGSRRRH